MVTKKILAIIAFFSIFSALSLADSIEIVASKTLANVNEDVLILAIAKFNNIANLRVNSIKIFENDRVIKECRNVGSEAFTCYTFVRSSIPTTRNYYAEIEYYYYVDPKLRSNTIQITWREDIIGRELVSIDNRLLDVLSILNLLRDLSNRNINLLTTNQDLLLEILDLVKKVSNNTDFLVRNQELLLDIIKIVRQTLNNTNLSLEVLKRVEDLLKTIDAKISAIDSSILREFRNIKYEIFDLIYIISYDRPKEYVADFSSISVLPQEKYCLAFEGIENKVIEENKFTVFVRNCGSERLYNVSIMAKIREDVQIKLIPIIYPNEVKYVYFTTNMELGEKELISLFAFNNLASAKYDFYIERKNYLPVLKIDFPEVEIKSNEWNEFFIKIRNEDNKAFRDIKLKIDVPSGVIYSIEPEKINLAPMQSKLVKVKMYVSEDFNKNSFVTKISAGEVEKLVNISVKKELKEVEKNLFGNLDEKLLIAIGVLIAMLIIFLIAFLVVRRELSIRKTIETF
ncbi:MAG: hypothetical protein QXT34_03745 [Candidatus Aenigmatarchaeota archaeon]